MHLLLYAVLFIKSIGFDEIFFTALNPVKKHSIPIIASHQCPDYVSQPDEGDFVITPKNNTCRYYRNHSHPDIILVNDVMGHKHGLSQQWRDKNKNIVTGAISVENLSKDKNGLKPSYWKEYDVFFNYRGDANIRCSADYMPTVEEFIKLPDHIPAKDRIIAMISNCVASRLDMVQKMCDAGFPIDLYGSCSIDTKGNSCQVIPRDDRWAGDWREQKMKLTKSYKFTLALENSRDDYYVTEKLYHPLQTNSIPIYWGDRDPTSKGLAPHPLSLLRYEDFDYIWKVMASSELQKLHRQSWRTREQVEKFYRRLPQNSKDIWEYLCDYYYEHRNV